MAQIDEKIHKLLGQRVASMRDERYAWWKHWRDLARYIYPRRYLWLETQNESSGENANRSFGGMRRNRRAVSFHNPDLLDSTSTLAARTLASGMLNGITSPARPWFRLRVSGLPDDGPSREWLDQVEEVMRNVINESNFYNAFATVYIDLVVFGTAAMIIYEDFDDVFRCYNFAAGEYYLQQDNRHVIRRFAREFYWRAEQLVREFGTDNVSDEVFRDFQEGGSRLDTEYKVIHIIEPNDVFSDDVGVPASFPFREVYYEDGRFTGNVLRVRGFNDWPGVFPRWDVLGNDSYGTSPSSDALPDIRQLQHMAKRKAQGMDKLISPPVVADIQLQNRPVALMPNGITFVAGVNNTGVQPLYTVNPPIAEIRQDMDELRASIRRVMHNDLFRMISEIDVGRTTATEVLARQEEKLVQLGPVLERFENEGLDPVIGRIFAIVQRRGLLPPPPPELEGLPIEVEYVSILSDAQRAVGAQPIERFVSFVGSIGQIAPGALEIPDWDAITRDYANKIGVKASNIRDAEDVIQARQLRETLQGIQAAGEAAKPLAEAAQTASQATTNDDNLLNQLLGGQ